MKNNYDLILNFEEKSGEPLSEKVIENMLKHGELLGEIIELTSNVKVWKVIVSQAVDSKRFRV